MDKLLALVCFLFGIVIVITTFPDGNAAVFVAALLSVATVFVIKSKIPEDQRFLIRIFIVAVLARLAFGLFLHTFEMRDFFGGDAITYDEYGNLLMQSWFGDSTGFSEITLEQRMAGVGWGMLYLVGGIYSFTGRNILAAQFFCAVIGAAISPLLYSCSYSIFNNRRVARVSAVLAAFFPAFIIWTGQLLKDGLIVFLIVLTITMVIQLQRKFSLVPTILVVFSLFGIISLRFYIFYMLIAAVLGTFLMGLTNSQSSMARRMVVIVLLGLGLTYLGVIRNATANLDKFGSLDKIQTARYGGSAETGSGFGEDINVSTTSGALSAIPVGLLYLYFAPFPWQLGSLRQSITLPDIIIWYSAIPFLFIGLLYSINTKLRSTLGILIFSVMLSLSYSLFQGNVGTAYRQRVQIQVFLFVFVAVGWTVFMERRENKKTLLNAQRKSLDEKHMETRSVFVES